MVGVARQDGDGFSTHFEVVVGLQRERGRIATLDPALGLLCVPLSEFEGAWRPTDGVTLVLFLPEDLPELTLVDAERGGGGS